MSERVNQKRKTNLNKQCAEIFLSADLRGAASHCKNTPSWVLSLQIAVRKWPHETRTEWSSLARSSSCELCTWALRAPDRHTRPPDLRSGTAPESSSADQRRLDTRDDLEWITRRHNIGQSELSAQCVFSPMSPGSSHRLKDLQCFWHLWTGRTRTAGEPSATTSQPITCWL